MVSPHLWTFFSLTVSVLSNNLSPLHMECVQKTVNLFKVLKRTSLPVFPPASLFPTQPPDPNGAVHIRAPEIGRMTDKSDLK